MSSDSFLQSWAVSTPKSSKDIAELPMVVMTQMMTNQLPARRNTITQTPTHVRAPSFKNAGHRQTIVMPVTAYLTKQGRTYTNSLSFRSCDLIQLKPPIKTENTYQLEPTKKFSQDHAKKVIGYVLQGHLKNEDYHPQIMAEQAKIMADIIKDQIKRMPLNRYKIVCSVTIGQKGSGDVCIASRALWDTNNDNYAQASFENKSLFATGLVYAIYQE